MNYSYLNCNMPTRYWQATEDAFYVAYYILPPIALSSAILSRIMCSFALQRQARKEGAYTYQMVLLLAEILLQIISAFYSVSIAFTGLSGAERRGNDFFTSSYICMWYRARLAAPLINAFVTVTLLLSVCMAADRVFALTQPYKYRLINHKRHRTVAFTVSFALGLSTSLFDVFRAKVMTYSHIGNRYSIAHDQNFVDSVTMAVLSHIRDFIRICSLAILIGLNSTLIYYYHVRMKRIRHISLLSSSSAEKKKNGERTLILLTLYQSLSSTIVMTFLTIFYVLFYSSPSVRLCGRLLIVPILDSVCFVTYGANIFIILAINRPFRKMVAKYWAIGRRLSS